MNQTQLFSERQQFANSCEAAVDFPKNLICTTTEKHTLKGYFEQLNERQNKLFGRDEEGVLDALQYESARKEFRIWRIEGVEDLKRLFKSKLELNTFDPRCRFVFIHAVSSRDILRVSREMFTFILTYHQVLPSFLDFIFPFGRTQYRRDFHFSGFRWANRMSVNDRGLKIPELGRSGKDIQMCYSLKAVEPSKHSTWSIRQAAIYHSFDVETGIAAWIIVKANKVIRERLLSATSSDRSAELSSLASNSKAFAASLAAHLFFLDWCSEGWRWYIDYLEEEFQRKTRRTLSMEVLSPKFENSFLDSELPVKYPVTELPTRTPNHLSPSIPGRSTRRQPPALPPPALKAIPMVGSQLGQGAFSFSDLQDIQFIDEKVNEVILVINANIGVLAELKQEYKNVIAHEDCPSYLSSECGESVQRFENRIIRITTDLLVVRSRAQTLLKSLADRKELLHGILQFRNMETSSLLALKSKISADNMEKMTQRMHELTVNMNDLAQDTKRETVSMRIITLVTLFFLPGTFISTIMSTDIIHFQSTGSGGSGRIFESAALELYIEITLPLMLFTFGAWYAVYKWESSKDPKISEQKHKSDV